MQNSIKIMNTHHAFIDSFNSEEILYSIIEIQYEHAANSVPYVYAKVSVSANLNEYDYAPDMPASIIYCYMSKDDFVVTNKYLSLFNINPDTWPQKHFIWHWAEESCKLNDNFEIIYRKHNTAVWPKCLTYGQMKYLWDRLAYLCYCYFTYEDLMFGIVKGHDSTVDSYEFVRYEEFAEED